MLNEIVRSQEAYEQKMMLEFQQNLDEIRADVKELKENHIPMINQNIQ
jgi:hypothetical protein